MPHSCHHLLSKPASQDGTKLLSGGCDNAVRLFDISTGQSSQVAQHDGPVKVVRSIETPQGSIVATGSWDKTLKVRADIYFSTGLFAYSISSTGIYGVRTQYRPSTFRSAATLSMSPILYWLSERQSGISRYSTCPTRPSRSRR